METCAHFARDGFETLLGLSEVLHPRYGGAPLVRLTMTSPPIEQCGDENHANRKGQAYAPGGEGGGEGETARQKTRPWHTGSYRGIFRLEFFIPKIYPMSDCGLK